MRFFKILAFAALPFIPFFPAPSAAQSADSDAWDFAQMAPELRRLSCPSDIDVFAFSPLKIRVTAVELGAPDDVERSLPADVTFVGGWHLTAGTSDFGGLSGLTITETGDLLAVSDKGMFITIGMASGAPDGRGQMGNMLDAAGKTLSGKRNGDAEGLAYREGIAFVSFERNHRVLAFDLDGCNAAARGVRVAQLPDHIEGNPINPNGGAEALWFGSDGRLKVGYETIINDQASLLTLDQAGGVIADRETVNVQRDFRFVGASGPAFLLRAYSRERGNRNEIRLTDQNIAFQLAPPLSVDNFEGVALDASKNGARRLYIISDDNFSGRQRTLLYAIDIAQP